MSPANRHGRIFILSAPSGAGKDSVIERLKQDQVAINYTLHTTTRPTTAR